MNRHKEGSLAISRDAGSLQATGLGLGGTAAMAYGWYVVAVLTVCYTFSFIDRQILSLLVEPIKADLGISDTQVGLLGGLAFSLFYTFLGLPVGRLVDRYNRRNILAIGIALWSMMTAACALARSFAGLFLARMGVGVGEAAMNPAAISIIADTFPKERLSSALSVYSMGIYLGSGLALILGGMVVQSVTQTPLVDIPIIGSLESWRVTFIVVGLPGLLVAFWLMTLREPIRHNAIVTSDGRQAALGIRDVVAELGRRWQSVLGISVAQTAMAIALYGFMLWAPVLFQRVHGWDSQQTGVRLGAVVLIGGCLGMFYGGRIADRWIKRGHTAAAVRLGAWSALLGVIVFGAALLVANDPWVTLGLFFPGTALLAMPTGSCYAALQMILPNQVRGQAVALFLFCANLGGMTLGPLLPGALNDYWFRTEGALATSMGWTLSGAMLIASVVFARTRSAYEKHYSMMYPA